MKKPTMLFVLVCLSFLVACDEQPETTAESEESTTENSNEPAGKEPDEPQLNEHGCKGSQERVPEDMSPYEIAATYPPNDVEAGLSRKLGAKNEHDLEIVKASITEYYGKPLTFYGFIEIDDYYNYKYIRAQKTHYSFRFVSSDGERIHVYGAKRNFGDLFKLLAKQKKWRKESRELPRVPMKVVIETDASHEDNAIWTLSEATPELETKSGDCAVEWSHLISLQNP